MLLDQARAGPTVDQAGPTLLHSGQVGPPTPAAEQGELGIEHHAHGAGTSRLGPAGIRRAPYVEVHHAVADKGLLWGLADPCSLGRRFYAVAPLHTFIQHCLTSLAWYPSQTSQCTNPGGVWSSPETADSSRQRSQSNTSNQPRSVHVQHVSRDSGRTCCEHTFACDAKSVFLKSLAASWAGAGRAVVGATTCLENRFLSRLAMILNFKIIGQFVPQELLRKYSLWCRFCIICRYIQ